MKQLQQYIMYLTPWILSMGIGVAAGFGVALGVAGSINSTILPILAFWLVSGSVSGVVFMAMGLVQQRRERVHLPPKLIH